jgi:hypothetical protein
MTTRRWTTAFALAAALGAALAQPATAQQDARWAPFVGCWTPAGGGDDAGLLCFRPAGAGVEMFNVVGGEITATEPLVADAQPRPVSAEGCTGSERVEFSTDGMRAYTRSDFACGAETRQGSGVMSFIEPNQWIDVRALSVAGEPVAWAQGYQLASAEQLAAQGISDPAAGNAELIRAARVRAARDIDIDDVEETASRVEARAVEVWIATHETPFELDGDEIVRLADAGIAESVIDVMVAVTYPERFVLSPEGAASEADRTEVAAGYPAGFRPSYRSYLWNPFFGPSYRYGYSPYSRFGYYDGFGGFGGYGGYWGYVPGNIIVLPAAPAAAPQERGRVVPGRGYARDTGSNDGGGGSGTARPASSSGGGGDDRGSNNGGGGSSSGGGGGGGRTASPR